MIHIFNRKELLITYDMQKQADVRTLLQNHGIDYSVKVLNRASPSPISARSRAYTGTFGQNLNNMYHNLLVEQFFRCLGGLYQKGDGISEKFCSLPVQGNYGVIYDTCKVCGDVFPEMDCIYK